jgi:GNAT superfamily N-acetyltransferase
MKTLYLFLILLGLMHSSFADNTKDVKNVLQQTLQEMNQSIHPSLHLELLKYCQGVIPTFVDWIFTDWSPYDRSLTKEKLIEGYTRRCNDDQLPFTIVAFKNSHPIGVITLKANETIELADLENGSPWGGSLHVLAEERNRGVGETLATAIVTIAKRLGYREIFFYLSESQGVNWCTKRGAEILETRPFRNHVITILRFKLDGYT